MTPEQRRAGLLELALKLECGYGYGIKQKSVSLVRELLAQDSKDEKDAAESIIERKAVRLTDEQIADAFFSWNSHCFGSPVESHVRFARTIESASLRANGIEP